MEAKLKPCPWCSGTDIKSVVDCGLFHILCIGCGAQGPTERLEVAARAEWNRRVAKSLGLPLRAPGKADR